MTDADSKFFPCDMRKINWDAFFTVYIVGLRRYMAKEDLTNVESAKRRYKRLAIIHYTLLFIFYVSLLCLIYQFLQYYEIITLEDILRSLSFIQIYFANI